MVFPLSKLLVNWVKILLLLVAGACLMVILLIANLKYASESEYQNTSMFHKRSNH